MSIATIITLVTLIISLITELVILLRIVAPIIRENRKIADGQRCQLRSEMLRIYYHHKESEELRQYELENFIMLYNAYKALGGNSFIDKIYKEVLAWGVDS